MPKLQVLKTLSEKTPKYQKCQTLTLMRVKFVCVLCCVFLGLLIICHYTVTEIGFIIMINSKKATTKCQCVTSQNVSV